jgi:acetyl esterase/lipase
LSHPIPVDRFPDDANWSDDEGNYRMKLIIRIATGMIGIAISQTSLYGQQTPPQDPITQKFFATAMGSISPAPRIMPLYDGPIPNSKAGPDEEGAADFPGMVQKVSNPTIKVFLPAKLKGNGSSIIIFPGGGYVSLSLLMEGDEVAKNFQDHGFAAFVVKYRLPSDQIMEDKSIGPLQDAQQAIRVVREHAKEWILNPARIGVIGFSAGGHLASTLGTHFEKSYIPNPDQVNLRPDFMILVYPVISMDPKIAHMGSRIALLGDHPVEDSVKLFSNETQVTEKTPPTLIIQAADDHLVDVDNSIVFFEALRHHDVSVDMTILEKGDHGLFLLARDDWQSIIFSWLDKHNWSKPQ